MALRLYQRDNREIIAFNPINPSIIGIYLCGPTVYDRAHIGNARNVVTFDLLYRLLRHQFGADNVVYVRNFTDIDDKINTKALQTARDIGEITDETIRWYREDMAALGALIPDHEPRATDYIPEMISFCKTLIDRGHAYAAEGHVLFDVTSYHEYGALSKRSIEEMIAGARVEVAPYKKNPMDFVLWKPSDKTLPGWDSPWGRGRPGWHIECSAMSHALLGESFDIHGGGSDLLFPHHENERAQSCCAFPDSSFARYWLHNEMLRVDGQKMSKSLGNFFTVRDVLDRGITGAVIRFLLMGTHYRKPLDWTEARLTEAKTTLSHWHEITKDTEAAETPSESVIQALSDDLNAPRAIAELHKLAKNGQAAELIASAAFMGLVITENDLSASPAQSNAPTAGQIARIEALLTARKAARDAKDFARADQIRDLLAAAGIKINDAKSGTNWEIEAGFDPNVFDESGELQ